MDIEVWKVIPGFNGKYEISNHGRIRSLWKGSPRLMILNTGGPLAPYVQTALLVSRRPKKYRNVRPHRLVLESFVGPCPEGHQAAHLDGNKLNNHVSNLLWVLPKENIRHNIEAGTYRGGHAYTLSESTYYLIRDDRAAGLKLKELAQKYNTTPRHISRICNEYARRKNNGKNSKAAQKDFAVISGHQQESGDCD
jgi:hypothetical protein